MQITDVDIVGDILERLRNQLSNLLSTRIGTLPLDRDFGLDMGFIDRPYPKFKQMYLIEVNKKIKKYIPAIKVNSIEFEINKTYPDKVKVTFNVGLVG